MNDQRDKEPQFICDAMLGRLAKWLRLLGYDATYFKEIEDNKIVDLALLENRTLLTRDTLMMKRRPIKNGVISALLVKSDHFIDQLQQVVAELDLKTDIDARCNICNTTLNDVNKEEIREKVPTYVFQTQDYFKICPICKRTYWNATHADHAMSIKNRLKAG